MWVPPRACHRVTSNSPSSTARPALRQGMRPPLPALPTACREKLPAQGPLCLSARAGQTRKLVLFGALWPSMVLGPPEGAMEAARHGPPHLAHLAPGTWPLSQRDPGPPARLLQLGWTPRGPCRHDVTGPHVLALGRPCPHKLRRAAAATGPSWPQRQAASTGAGDPKGQPRSLCSQDTAELWSQIGLGCPLPFLLSLGFLLGNTEVTTVPVSQTSASHVLGMCFSNRSASPATDSLGNPGLTTLALLGLCLPICEMG